MFYQLADALVDNVADMDLEDLNIASAAAGALSNVLGSGAVSADSLVSHLSFWCTFSPDLQHLKVYRQSEHRTLYKTNKK